MKTVCDLCNKEFDRKPSHIQKYNYCSPECYHEASKNGRIIKCVKCGKSIYKRQSHLKCEVYICNECRPLVIHDWSEIQEYYDEGYSICECMNEFGFSRSSYNRARNRGDFISRTHSEAMKLASKRGKLPQTQSAWYTKEKRDYMSKIAKKNHLGGNNSSCTIIYKGIRLDSTFELRYASYLDYMNIKWVRPELLKWIDSDNKQHRYYPDFYLTNEDKYIDTKNDYLINKHENKINQVIKQNDVLIEIISEADLDKLCV